MASNGLQKVRTFANDVQRVQGNTAPTNTPAGEDAAVKKAPTMTRPPNTLSREAPVPKPKPAETHPEAQNKNRHVQDAVSSLSAQVPEQRPDTTEVPPSETQKRSEHHGLQSSADALITENEIGEGVIVNDKKHQRWTLGKAVAKGVGGWVNEKKQELTELAEGPQPNTAPAHTRAHIIREAGERGRLAPQDDHEAVVERLRTFEQDATRAQEGAHAQIKKDVDVSGQWTHTTQPSKKPTPTPVPSIKKAPPVERPVREKTPTPSRDTELVTPGYTQKTSEPLRTLRSDSMDEVSEKKLTVPKIAAAARKSGTPRQAPATLPRHTSLAPVLVVATLIFILLGGGATYLFWQKGGEPTANTRADVPTFIGGITQIPFALPTNTDVLLTALSERVAQTTVSQNALVQYYPEVTTDAGARTATAEQFVGVLNPQTPGSFVRNLQSEMMFGAHTRDGNAPFFIFTHESFDVAFAGMLAWEGQLQRDFAPLFGTQTQNNFVDERVDNHDVRVLYNDTGEAVVVYGFPRQDTLILTTNHETFRVLTSRLR